jgi:hypothetical protein
MDYFPNYKMNTPLGHRLSAWRVAIIYGVTFIYTFSIVKILVTSLD